MAESSGKIWSMILIGKKKVFGPALCGGSVPGLALNQAWPLKFMLVFVFYETFKWL